MKLARRATAPDDDLLPQFSASSAPSGGAVQGWQQLPIALPVTRRGSYQQLKRSTSSELLMTGTSLIDGLDTSGDAQPSADSPTGSAAPSPRQKLFRQKSLSLSARTLMAVNNPGDPGCQSGSTTPVGRSPRPAPSPRPGGAAAGQAADQPRPTHWERLGTVMVLIACADPQGGACQRITQFMAAEGYDVATQATLPALLQHWERSTTLADLVLIIGDLGPDPCLSVLAAVRKAVQLQPVMVLAPTGAELPAEAALQAGADDFVRDPVPLEELVARVERHVQRQHTWKLQLNSALEGAKADLAQSLKAAKQQLEAAGATLDDSSPPSPSPSATAGAAAAAPAAKAAPGKGGGLRLSVSLPPDVLSPTAVSSLPFSPRQEAPPAAPNAGAAGGAPGGGARAKVAALPAPSPRGLPPALSLIRESPLEAQLAEQAEDVARLQERITQLERHMQQHGLQVPPRPK